MFTYKIKIPNTGLIAHFKRNFKKQKWGKYNERALVFYTKFHVQALKSTLIGTYEIYSLYTTF